MNRTLSAVLMILWAALLLHPAEADTAPRRLTLMIYMCGSNLESGHGAASTDIEEMKASGLKSRDVTVLLMTGGSSQWSQGYDPAQCLIHELGPRGTRIVWRSEALSMGSPDTLTQLLRFGAETYPAENYALILWDHGGGPAEGLCWDELFSLDQLSVPELSQAIRQAELPKKLSWIGFDACLMASLEVASAVEPYAEYMIASQETEPSTGWNYGFLGSLGDACDGASVGRRVIDDFMAENEGSADVVTLSCIDLKRVSAAVGAVQAYFEDNGPYLAGEAFDTVSLLRNEAFAFGEGVRDMGESGYDLVDAVDLLSRLSRIADGQRAETALQDAVVYSRSNADRAHGLTLYHPYINKSNYLNKWKASYDRLHFSEGYTRYLNRFGARLTGRTAVDWSGLITANTYLGDGLNRVTLQLTEEQAAHTVQARLMILAGGVTQPDVLGHCVLVYMDDAAIDGDGLISAAYRGRALYIVGDRSEPFGPVSFGLSNDAQSYAVTAIYTPEGKGIYEDADMAIHFLERDSGGDQPAITATWVYDEETEVYSNRLALKDGGYRQVNFQYFFRDCPETEGDTPLSDFMAWPVWTDNLFSYALQLPQDWHFQFEPGFASDDQYFALFQLTDLQQNVFCSQPVKIQNPLLWSVTEKPMEYEADDYSVKLSVCRSYADDSLHLFAEVVNHADQARKLSLNGCILNGTRSVYYPTGFFMEAGGRACERIDIPAFQLFGLEDLRTIEIGFTDYDAQTAWTAGFTLDEAYDLSDPVYHPAVQSETVVDNVSYQLLELRQNKDDHLSAVVRIQNDSRETLTFGGNAVLNGLQVEINSYSLDVAPGYDACAEIPFSNEVSIHPLASAVEFPDVDSLLPVYRLEGLLERQGIESISEIRLLPFSDTNALFAALLGEPLSMAGTVSLPLKEPFAMQSRPVQDDMPWVQLTESPDGVIRSGRLMLGRNGLILFLDIENKAETVMLVKVQEASVNGVTAKPDSFASAFAVGSKAEKFVCTNAVLPEGFDPSMKVSAVTLTLQIDGEEAVYMLRLKTPSPLGTTAAVTIDADEYEIIPVLSRD